MREVVSRRSLMLFLTRSQCRDWQMEEHGGAVESTVWFFLCVGFLLIHWLPPTDQKQAPLFSSNGTFTFKLPPVVFLTGFALTEEAEGGALTPSSPPESEPWNWEKLAARRSLWPPSPVRSLSWFRGHRKALEANPDWRWARTTSVQLQHLRS